MPHARVLEDITIYKMCRKIEMAEGVLPTQVPGLVADALVQWPRPEWVERMVGPYPQIFEDVNPADIADPKEWGGAGTGT